MEIKLRNNKTKEIYKADLTDIQFTDLFIIFQKLQRSEGIAQEK